MQRENFEKSGHPRVRGARSLFLDIQSGNEPSYRAGTVPGYDGTPIFYCEEGSGPPLVFCYGIACSTLHWTYQIDYFRQHYRCIWFDYRGHRRTPIPDRLDSMTVESASKDLETVLAHLGVHEAVFLGHSMGASVVLQFAKDHPERVKRMVLANGTAKKPLETLLGGNYLGPAFDVLSKAERMKPDWVQNIWKLQYAVGASTQLLGNLGFNKSLCHPGDIETYSRQIAELPPVVLTQTMNDYQAFDASAWLHELKQPALVISGEKDFVTPPETQDLMHQLLPDSRMARVPHGSHCSTLDSPEYICLLIERFLNER
jgi:pimeloyl-ACP methyl ester carboxylesterase